VEFLLVVSALVVLVGYYLFNSMQDMKIRKAEKAVQSGDLDTALTIFSDALKRNPNDIEALWHLGNINEEKKQLPEAIGYYTKLIEIGKESKFFNLYELYKRVGLLYHTIDRDQDALDFLMQAYNLMQSSKEVLETIAMIIYSQRFFHRAIPYFEKAYQHLKKKPDFLKNFGLCLVLVDRFNDAVSLLEDSAREDPHDYQSRYVLSYAYYKTGTYKKSRENIEDIINVERASLTGEELYFVIKILFLIYLEDKNYEIARELINQLKKINSGSINNPSFEEETEMAYIFFRIRQGYYDIALESIGKNINLKESTEELTEEEKQHAKESQSHIFELVSTLNKYKKESEKSMYSGNKPLKQEIDFTALEDKYRKAEKEVANMYEDWKVKFVSEENLWKFFRPRIKSEFDPSIILDKYAEESVQSLRKRVPAGTIETSDKMSLQAEQTEDPCETFLSADLPKFLEMSMKLVDNMGFKVINQAVKIDSLAYSEGKAVDMLCEEKYQKDSRVLFCIRRWKEPVGYLSIQPILQSMKTLQATRLIFITTSSLSLEATRAMEGNPSIQVFQCEDVAANLLG
jgi:tetratricopeptide (TPR) repeat protein